jgi:hypothetical protein
MTLALENKTIPPNINFSTPNPKSTSQSSSWSGDAPIDLISLQSPGSASSSRLPLSQPPGLQTALSWWVSIPLGLEVLMRMSVYHNISDSIKG